MPLKGHVEVIGSTPLAALKAAAWPEIFFEQIRLNREKCTRASIGIRSLFFALLNSFLAVPPAWELMVVAIVIPQLPDNNDGSCINQQVLLAMLHGVVEVHKDIEGPNQFNSLYLPRLQF